MDDVIKQMSHILLLVSEHISVMIYITCISRRHVVHKNIKYQRAGYSKGIELVSDFLINDKLHVIIPIVLSGNSGMQYTRTGWVYAHTYMYMYTVRLLTCSLSLSFSALTTANSCFSCKADSSLNMYSYMYAYIHNIIVTKSIVKNSKTHVHVYMYTHVGPCRVGHWHHPHFIAKTTANSHEWHACTCTRRWNGLTS